MRWLYRHQIVRAFNRSRVHCPLATRGPSLHIQSPMFVRVSCFIVAVLLLCALPVELWAADFQHTPAQPKSGQPVTITARGGGGASVNKATLFVQIVEPGNYVRRTDAAYTNSWRELALHDDGRDGDVKKPSFFFASPSRPSSCNASSRQELV